MTFNYLSGEVERGPVHIDEALFADPDPKPSELENGETAFVALGALWAVRQTGQLFVDESYDTWQIDEMFDKNILEFARLLRFSDALFVDISHIGEMGRQTHGRDMELFEFRDSGFRFPTLTPEREAELLPTSVAVDGDFITDEMNLDLFRDHWNAVYGETGPLIGIKVRVRTKENPEE